jgi:hypothetical protein
MEAFRTCRARFVKSTTFRRRCASVFMSWAELLGQMVLLTAHDFCQADFALNRFRGHISQRIFHFFEIALVLLRLDHVAPLNRNANHSIV